MRLYNIRNAAAPLQSAAAYELVCRLALSAGRDGGLPPLVTAAIGEIREHYAGIYGIAELAAELGVGKSHLVRSFAKAVGIPPGRYLSLVRVEAAKMLLAHREYTLDAVAGLCGFSGANYLCRVFKKTTGQSPQAWRRAYTDSAPPPRDTDALEEGLYL
jgi:AraC-like DNA-binding protein